MVSEQIRKIDESGEEEAVETQDSGSASGGQKIDKESDIKADKPMVSSATSSRTRIPAAAPPPPPARSRHDSGVKLPLDAKRVKPPPPPSSKNSVKPTPDSDRDTGNWAPVTHDDAEIDGFDGLAPNDVEELGLNNSTVRNEDSLELPTINLDVALKGIDKDFNVESRIGEKTGLDDLDSSVDDENPQSTPAAVAPSEPMEVDEDTGEMPALKTDTVNHENKISDSTAAELQEVSEVELESQQTSSAPESTSVDIEPAPELVPASDSDADSETETSVIKTETDAGSALVAEAKIDQPEDSQHDSSTAEAESVTTVSESETLNQGLEIEPNSTLSSVDSEPVVVPESSSEQYVDGIPSSEFESEFEDKPQGDPDTEPSKTPEILSLEDADFLKSIEPEALEVQVNNLEPTEIEMPQAMPSSAAQEETPSAISDSGDNLPARRNLSSLVAKSKNERPTQNFALPTESTKEFSSEDESHDSGQQTDNQTTDSSSVELSATKTTVVEDNKGVLPAGDFEVGQPVIKTAGKSKFASLLAPSLGETTSMREIMESELVPVTETFTGSPPPGFDFGDPKPPFDFLAPPEMEFTDTQTRSDFGDAPSANGFAGMLAEPAFLKTDNTGAGAPEPTAPGAISQPEVLAEPVLPPPPPAPSPLGADGLPEPWMNLGKMLKDRKKDDNSTGTTSNTRPFSAIAPKSTSEDIQMVSATNTNQQKLTEQEMPKPAEEDVTDTQLESGTASAANEVSTNALSSQQYRRLGALQRTGTNETSWTPPALERSSTDWDIVPPSEQDFAIVFQEEQDLIKPFLEDQFITPATAEEVFLKGDVIEACRQYHVLIERMENNPKPNIAELVNWSEALADLYILMDEPAHAVSFYHKARTLASESEPRRVQKYLSCLLKLSTRYEEDGMPAEAEKTYLEAIKIAGDELDAKDILHQRIDEAYKQHSKRKKLETADSAAIEEQCTTLRMRAVKGTDKAFSATRKPTNVKEIFEETKLEKAAPPERIRRATGSEIEFKATRGLEELSSKPFIRVLNSIWVQVILGVILMMCCLACVISLRVGEQIAPPPLAVEVTGEYKTVDHLKSIKFQADNKFEIWDSGKYYSGTFKPIRGNSDDLIDLLRGHLHSKTMFYSLSDKRMIDDEGRALFTADAPEMAVAKQMWWYAAFATWHYREKHCYQTSTEPWNKVNPDFIYVNPFTGKPTYATITPSTGAGNKLLPLVVSGGQMYEGEPPPGPGAIRCVCFDKVRFFVRGFDRDGKILRGVEPGKAADIELTDGVNVTEKYRNTFIGKCVASNGMLPLRIMIVTEEGKDIASNYKSLTTLAPACILSLLFLSVAVTVIQIVKKRAKLQWYHYLTTSIAVILTIGWYAMALG